MSLVKPGKWVASTHYSRLLPVVTGDPLFSTPHAAQGPSHPLPSLLTIHASAAHHGMTTHATERESRNNTSLSTWPLGAANCVTIQSEMRCFTAGWQLLRCCENNAALYTLSECSISKTTWGDNSVLIVPFYSTFKDMEIESRLHV